MRGDLAGASLLFFPRESAINLADLLNRRPKGTTSVLKEMDRSALGELGSILTAAYVRAISDMLDMDVELSVPSVVFDVASAIVYFVLLSSKEKIRYSLVSKAGFVSSEESISGEFMLLLDDKTLLNLLNAAYVRLKKTKDASPA
jgi:chemotaxis protein CheC